MKRQNRCGGDRTVNSGHQMYNCSLHSRTLQVEDTTYLCLTSVCLLQCTMHDSIQMWHNTQQQTIGKTALTVLLYSYTLCSVLEIK